MIAVLATPKNTNSKEDLSTGQWTQHTFDQMTVSYHVNLINDELINQREGDALSTASMTLQITNC